ncbi:hypothetical protein [Croceiramulus getboli]|nr:hypothetical protein P8624_08405 [Flavobacteriaceae bacterium YJPT1-3]
MVKVLHFTPVRKTPEILKMHLKSLAKLDQNGDITITFSFYDDNKDPNSSEILKSYVEHGENRFLHSFNLDFLDDYHGKERWEIALYKRITKIKDAVIKYFLESEFDYLFLTDADLVLHPETISILLEQKKDFCSQVFWTHFNGSMTYTPNCWKDIPKGFTYSDLIRYRQEGTYEVDFTGACTLLSRAILEDGVRFEKISNVSFLGEDKHFCIRAAVAGYSIFVNTEAPAFHIYDNSLLELADDIDRKSDFKGYLDSWLNERWEKDIQNWLNPSPQTFVERIIKRLR